MKKIKLVLAILLILAALGTIINKSFFGGLLMLILGVVLLPIVSNELSSRIEFWNKKPFRYAFYILMFLFSAGIVNKKGLTKSKKDNLVIKENAKTKSETNFQYKTCDYGGDNFYIIPDMIAADIYPNFENKGFKIDKQIKSDHTSIYCELSLPNEKFTVIITGCSPEEIIQIEATAIDNSGNNQKEVEDFLGYVAASQYKNSEPEKARKWIKENIDTDGASTIIGGVTFSISFKSTHSKFLRMEINNIEKVESKKELIELDHSEYWEKYDTIVKVRIYKMIQEKDCSGLQQEFNTTADNMDKLQASGKSASRNLDLMGFLEKQMKEFDCH